MIPLGITAAQAGAGSTYTLGAGGGTYAITGASATLTRNDIYFSSVVSLLHFEGANLSTTFTDEKGKTWTPVGQTHIGTTQFKYGSAAGLWDGSGDYITTPSHADFNFGTGEFTIECWARWGSIAAAGNQALVVRDQIGGTRGWLLYIGDGTSGTTNDALSWVVWVGGTAYQISDTVAVTTFTWFHVAAVRDQSSGDVIRLYKNGVQCGSGTAITGSAGAPSEPCVVGSLWGIGAPLAGNYHNGNMDDMRITKGICRYPGGTTFTPPPAQFLDA